MCVVARSSCPGVHYTHPWWIASRRLVEHLGHSWVHLDELPHEPPGWFFEPRLGNQKQVSGTMPTRSALFHYVPGGYMRYLHFVSSQACTCAVSAAEVKDALELVAVGVYSPTRRLARLDEKQIEATWGAELSRFRFLQASGRDHTGVAADVARMRELLEAFPDAGWLLLLPVEHYVVPANFALRVRALERRPDARSVMVSGPGARVSADGFDVVEYEDGALLVGRDLATTIMEFAEPLSGGVFPLGRRYGDRGIFAWARTLSRVTVLQDPGLVRRLPDPAEEDVAGCPATFPMDPDLADLKPEFTLSEGDSVIHVTKFLLQATRDKECAVEESDGRGMGSHPR